MSSILKALKKLDDDLPRKRRTVIWPSGSKTRKTMRRWDISAGRSANLLWGLLGVAVVIAAGALFVYLKPSPENRTPEKVAVTRQITKPEQPVPISKPPVRLPAAQPREVIAPQPQPQPAPEKPGPKPAPSPAVEKKPPLPNRPPPEQKKAAKPSGPTTAGLPILTSGLKLQAISWAPAAGDRLAVINGSIVREGASLDGYVIVQIDKDEVAVRKGAEQWKLVFDLK